MKIRTMLFIGYAAATAAAGTQAAVTVTTGAGYVKMVEALAEAYRADAGAEVHTAFGGNIGQMLAQIQSGNGVNVVISDRTSLKKFNESLASSPAAELGKTPLVLVWKQGLALASPDDLVQSDVKSVAYPDPKAAIYGRAADEFLNSSGLGEKIAAKINVVSTVPQVFSYVSTGQMDAGFINLLAARQGQKKLGGMLVVESGYAPIEMIALPVQGQENDKDVKRFLEFLSSPKAEPILNQFGVVR